MGAFLFRSGFAHVDNVITKKCSKTITWLLLSRLQVQGNKPHRNSPEPSETLELSGTFRKLPPEPTPAHAGTVRNLPEPASGTYTSTCLQNLHQQTPELSGTLRNSPELSGTCLRNLHQQTPELSGTFWNLPPEPPPATRTGTHRSLSGLKTPLAYAVGEKCHITLLYSSIPSDPTATGWPEPICTSEAMAFRSLMSRFMKIWTHSETCFDQISQYIGMER